MTRAPFPAVPAVLFGVALLATPAAPQVFHDVLLDGAAPHIHQDTPSAGRMGSGVAFFDMDGDHDDDLFWVSSAIDHTLLRNDGGSYVDVTAGSGVSDGLPHNTMGVIAADYDDDGDVDLYLTNRGKNQLLANLGDGTFTEVAESLGLDDGAWGTSATWADFDLDGDLDLYVGNYIAEIDFPYHIGAKNRLYLNEGTSAAPVFVDRAAELGVDVSTVFPAPVPPWIVGKEGQPTAGCTLSVSSTDYDGDGDPDLAIGNDFGIFIMPNLLYRNDGVGEGGNLVFTDVSAETGFGIAQFNMGINWGDYDRDGDWDAYLTDLGPNALLRNDEGVFTEVVEQAGPVEGEIGPLFLTSWASLWVDVDNDGWEDLYVANGFIPADSALANEEESANGLWRNLADGTFSKVSQSGVANKGVGRGLASADYDGDGFVDMALLNNGFPGLFGIDLASHLYNNSGSLATGASRWAALRLIGVRCNVEALGAQVDGWAGGEVMRRQVRADPVYQSSSSRQLHFGLGAAPRLERVELRWPDGTYQELHGVPAGMRLLVVEPRIVIDAVGTPAGDGSELDVTASFSNLDPEPRVFTAKFTLLLDGRTVFTTTTTGSIGPGQTVPSTISVELPRNAAGLSGVELQLRVDVTDDISRALDTRVVPVVLP